MKTACKIFFAGMAISCIGALPPGTMTISATYIGASQGFVPGIIYGAGSALAESIVILCLLYSIKWINRWNSISRLLQLFATLFLAALTIGCFYLASTNSAINITGSQFHPYPFTSGFTISILNPLHIPFWLGWSTVLSEKKLLTPERISYAAYIAGIASGSMTTFILYIYGGRYLLDNFMRNQQTVIVITGSILLVITCMHIKKLAIKRSPAAVKE